MAGRYMDEQLIAKEIATALGLKHVRKLYIHMGVDELMTVKAELYPEIDGMRQVPSIIRKFKLVPIKGDPVEVQEFGDKMISFEEPSDLPRDIAIKVRKELEGFLRTDSGRKIIQSIAKRS